MKHILITIAAVVLVGCGESQLSISSSEVKFDKPVPEVEQLRELLAKKSKVIQELESRVKDMLELHNNAEKKYMTREDFYDLAREKNSSEILRWKAPHHRTQEQDKEGVIEFRWIYRNLTYDPSALRVDSNTTLYFSDDKCYTVSFSTPIKSSSDTN
jgi:hypothetical protein